MLKKSVYAGFFTVNGVRHELDKSIPRIITEEEHYRILKMLGIKNQARFQKHENTYSGFLKGERGEYMRADPKFQLICDCRFKFAYRNKENCPKCKIKISKMVNPKYLTYTYYYNGIKRHRDKKVKRVEEKLVIEKTYEEIIEPLSLCPELVSWFKESVHEVEDKIIKEKIELGSSRVKMIEEIEKEKDSLRSQNRRGIITDEEYIKDLALLEKRVPAVENQKRDWAETMSEIVDLGLDCKEMFEKGDVKSKKKVLFKSQSNLIWNEENLYIVRPKWLDKYVETIKQVKNETYTVEPNSIEKNPNKNKDIPAPNFINSASHITLSGC